MSFITQQMKENASSFKSIKRGTEYEKGEAQTFTNDFFKIFGIERRTYVKFEKQIRRKDDNQIVFADAFWPGKLLIESKSAKKDSEKDWENTLSQAIGYIDNLDIKTEKPKYIILYNFLKFKIYKTEIKSNSTKSVFIAEVLLDELDEKIEHFSFIPQFIYELEQEEVQLNDDAVQRISSVYIAIKSKIPNLDDTAIFLSRILFCLFAEDTGIFNKKQFENFVRVTPEADLKDELILLFDSLNTDKIKRKKNLNSVLNAFPYVNGGLFEKKINQLPVFNKAIKDAILVCCAFDWSLISTVIFGSLFQSVLRPEERKESGSHYTSEKNILRVIRPLFLDDLYLELDNVKSDIKKLEKFRQKIHQLLFLDPACGCGNFLVVTYKELRLLDIEIIKHKTKITKQLPISVNDLVNISLDHFYGIEINQSSCMIAEVALWLTEHQLNLELSKLNYGISIPTIPLIDSAVIQCENALTIEWKANNKFTRSIGNSVSKFDYIFGNPPFAGSRVMTKEQKKWLTDTFEDKKDVGELDFVCGWYVKAAIYLQKNIVTKVAFVSTNSIIQGMQTGILWQQLFNKYKINIHFAHQTFKWNNEAKGVAAVYCVIVGFGMDDPKEKIIYEYPDIKGEPVVKKAKSINQYLIDASITFIKTRQKPLCIVPEMDIGNMPADGGNLLFTNDEKIAFIKRTPQSKKYFKELISAREFLNNKKRWCLWIEDNDLADVKKITTINNILQEVKKVRLKSARPKLASIPHKFAQITQPAKKPFILIPRHSSENRAYIPMGLFDYKSISADSCLIIPNGSLFHFGVLQSSMHMSWVRYVCGRLKSDYRYSKDIVYNNYPFPQKPNVTNKKAVEKTAQKILDLHKKHLTEGVSLAEMYSEPMLVDLQKAHEENNKAVDKCYSNKSFSNDLKRIEFLFDLYEQYSKELFS